MSLRVLVGCEFSGVVRDAFRVRGHDAWSCDLLPTEVDGPHLQGDVFKAIAARRWDVGIFHPPCTTLTRAGDRWYRDSPLRLEAAEFVKALYESDIPCICIENPRGALNRLWRRPDQVIQPWMFGHGETKATCLWLKNLPPLMATSVSTGREQRIWHLASGACHLVRIGGRNDRARSVGSLKQWPRSGAGWPRSARRERAA